jgi:hypothetical protein
MFARGSMGSNKRFTILLVLLFLVSMVAAASHHHETTADDHDCPLCLAANHQAAIHPSTTAFDITPCLKETPVVISLSPLVENLFVSSRSTRGPPA